MAEKEPKSWGNSGHLVGSLFFSSRGASEYLGLSRTHQSVSTLDKAISLGPAWSSQSPEWREMNPISVLKNDQDIGKFWVLSVALWEWSWRLKQTPFPLENYCSILCRERGSKLPPSEVTNMCYHLSLVLSKANQIAISLACLMI